ncbi:MAG: hypothetical protein JRD49_15395, partial [Deltaproteobacteria bacterium]|nr:hypothetical protein [Deltaproteobacteria bacterium]
QCSQETEIYSRVVGYLRPVKQWNNGKQAEFEKRKTFKVTGVSDKKDPAPPSRNETPAAENVENLPKALTL